MPTKVWWSSSAGEHKMYPDMLAITCPWLRGLHKLGQLCHVSEPIFLLHSGSSMESIALTLHLLPER